MSDDGALDILILGLNYAPERVGIAVYTTGLAEALAARGHRVRAVVGKPYYPAWSVLEEFRGGWRKRSVENAVELTRVAHYVPAQPSGPKRIMHHLTFALSALPSMVGAVFNRRPDLVLTIAPSLLGAPVARAAAALSGAKSWVHIQDFEVEAAVATGLVKQKSAMALAMRLEKAILKSFHRVSSIAPAMCRKCEEKGIERARVIEFRNWADVDNIQPLAGPSPYRAEWNITTPHVALYSGNIANKQGIDIVVDAARALRERSDLTFVVCGEGPNRAKLMEQSATLGNIMFHDLQPKERLGDLLRLASVHLLPQLASAADLVLPSKLTNMLASGRPVVATAHVGTGLAQEVEGCGLVVPPEDVTAFTGAITHLLDHPDEASALGRSARARAEERWVRSAIIDRFEHQAQRLVHGDTAVDG
ncbi:WcaI family glycosyltransferase [Xanthobacter aminoxidans]|uniref:WcaI family glycosyltransferase n=1 Tax=Xanthobacter aminoxidans TaxID=186280 RepID=UPI0037284B39